MSAPHKNYNENWECWKEKLRISKPRKWNDLQSKTCHKNSSEVLLHAFQIQCRGILTIQTWLYGCNHQSTISMKCSSPETCLFVTNSPRQASPQSLPQCCQPSCAPSTSRSLKMRQSFNFQNNVETKTNQSKSKASLTRVGDIKIAFKNSGHLLLIVNQRWVWLDPVSGWSLLCK